MNLGPLFPESGIDTLFGSAPVIALVVVVAVALMAFGSVRRPHGRC